MHRAGTTSGKQGLMESYLSVIGKRVHEANETSREPDFDDAKTPSSDLKNAIARKPHAEAFPMPNTRGEKPSKRDRT